MSIDLNDRLNKTWLHPNGEPVKRDIEVEEEDDEDEEVSQQHFCHSDHEVDVQVIKNNFDSETHQLIDTQQASLENGIQNIEGEVVGKILSKVQRTKNAFEEPSDMMSARDKAMFINELTIIVAGYYASLFPVFANQLIKTRAQEFGQQGNFRMTKAIERYIQVTARRASDSHINTIINDIQKTAHEAYEEELARHLKDAKDAGKSGAESYEYARKRALEGASQQRIISEITTKYQDISKNRAKTIARTETNRAFTQSQFQADLQFLKDTGLMDSAYKQWVTRSENPCPYCLELASRGPIPFDENFESLGAELHYDYTKKNGEIVKRTLKIDYEDLEAGNAHVNCQCKYKLIIKDANGNFVENGFRFAKVLNKGYNPNRDPKTGKFSTGAGGPLADPEVKESLKSLAKRDVKSSSQRTVYKNQLNKLRDKVIPVLDGNSEDQYKNKKFMKTWNQDSKHNMGRMETANLKALNGEKSVMSSEYKFTQAYYKNAGIKNVTLYRGISGKQGIEVIDSVNGKKDFTLSADTAASWTDDVGMAHWFATRHKNGVILKKTFPVEKVVTSYRTNPYLTIGDENEYIIANTSDEVFSEAKRSKYNVATKKDKSDQVMMIGQ